MAYPLRSAEFSEQCSLLNVCRKEDGSIVEILENGTENITRCYTPAKHPTVKYSVLEFGDFNDIKKNKKSYKTSFVLTLFTCGYYLLYLSLMFFVIIICNPYLMPEFTSENADFLILPDVIAPNPDTWRLGCDTSVFCDSILDPPILNASYMVILPNFTDITGNVSNYGAAALVMLGILKNDSCNVRATGLFGGPISKNDTLWDALINDLTAAVIVLKYNCHPEAFNAALDPGMFRAKGFTKDYFLPTVKPLPCDTPLQNNISFFADIDMPRHSNKTCKFGRWHWGPISSWEINVNT